MASIRQTFLSDSDVTNVNLGTLARRKGWNGSSKLNMFFSNVGTIRANVSTSLRAAIESPAFPTGSKIRLTNRGNIFGQGGNGGRGGGSQQDIDDPHDRYTGRGRVNGSSGYHGENGKTGKVALRVKSPITFYDRGGTILPGGGGGGGGGGGTGFHTPPTLGGFGGCNDTRPALPPRFGSMRSDTGAGSKGGKGRDGCTLPGSKAANAGVGEAHRGRYGGKGGKGGAAGSPIDGEKYITRVDL